jgi:hypothetical protein
MSDFVFEPLFYAMSKGVFSKEHKHTNKGEREREK